nr:hypothetical protein [Candidatus Sigynarchaeota archaeon]
LPNQQKAPSCEMSAGHVIGTFDLQTQCIINGWLIACGSLDIDEAARVLSKEPGDIMLHVFGEIGKGTLQARFKDRKFVLDESFQYKHKNPTCDT